MANTKSATKRAAKSALAKTVKKTGKSVTKRSAKTSVKTAKTTPRKTVSKKAAVKKAAPKKTMAKTAAKSAKPQTLAALRAHVDDIEKRLKRADSLTRASVKSLKASYNALEKMAANNRPAGKTRAGSKALDGQLQALSERLTGMIEQTRKDMANDLQVVLTDPRLGKITDALNKANKRLSRAEANQAEAINAINAHIARLASAFDSQIEEEKQARKQADKELAGRIDDIEQESANAIKTIGDKVVGVSDELQSRLKEMKQELAEEALSRNSGFEQEKHDLNLRMQALEESQPRFERELENLAARLNNIEAGTSPKAAYAPIPPASAPVAPSVEDNPYANALNTASDSVDNIAAASEPDAFTPPDNEQDGAGETVVIKEYVPQEYIPQENMAVAVGQNTNEQAQIPPYANNTTNAAVYNNGSAQAGFQPMAEPTSIAENVYEFAPPPMPDINPNINHDLPPGQKAGFEPGMADFEPSMESVRPGAEPAKAKKSKLKKNEKSANILRLGLLTGVAIIGLVAGKALAPKLLGGDKPVRQASQQSQNTVQQTDIAASETMADNANPDSIAEPAIKTTPPVGDYSKGQTAPKLDNTKAGKSQKMTLQKAAVSGNPVAQFQLGLSHLENGRNAEGVRLIRLAANQGQPAAQYRLAKLYEAGIGVQVNNKTAKSLLEKSAKAGNRIAMHDLAYYYVNGTDGSSPDLVKAVGWFTQAAERGVVDSQFNLGMLYQGGSGVKRSLPDAYFWYAIAGNQGDEEAAQKAEAIALDLDKEVLAKLQSRVKAFAPKPVNNAANGIFTNLPWIVEPPKTAASQLDRKSVKQVQIYLGKLGYDVGPPDGAMGPKTRNAIIRFENANGLPATGRVSAELLDRLAIASSRA